MYNFLLMQEFLEVCGLLCYVLFIPVFVNRGRQLHPKGCLYSPRRLQKVPTVSNAFFLYFSFSCFVFFSIYPFSIQTISIFMYGSCDSSISPCSTLSILRIRQISSLGFETLNRKCFVLFSISTSTFCLN